MIIGISGKIGSGKDTVGLMIQALSGQPTCLDGIELNDEVLIQKVWDVPRFKNKRFADALKDCVCVILKCTRKQLEDRKFKNKTLDREWWVYDLGDRIVPYGYYDDKPEDKAIADKRFLRKTTPRIILQLLGTEAGRNIIHPNVWVLSLFAEYKSTKIVEGMAELDGIHRVIPKGHGEHSGKRIKSAIFRYEVDTPVYPNWVITDMRFPNELAAIKKRGGITIRVERPVTGDVEFKGTEEEWDALVAKNKAIREHPSETALDDAEFDYVIYNSGTLYDLLLKVKQILKKEGVLK